MKSTIGFLTYLAILGIPGLALADQAATITCTGANVILATKSPYLGENSKFAQELYVLKTTDNEEESKNTAYFLDVEQDVGGARHCFGTGSLIYTGRNKSKGKFQLCIHVWKDVGNGTVIRQISNGVITYSHGPIRGTNESVSCIKE